MATWKFLFGLLATCLIAVGIAAQTGTVHIAGSARHAQTTVVGSPAVPPQPQIVRPAPPAPAAPPPASAPVQTNGDQGDGEGDGGGD